MGLRHGLQALKDMKTEKSSNSGDARRFILNDGESAVVRFFGDFVGEQDPVIGFSHYVKRLPKPFHNCGENAEKGHAGCVFCWAKTSGDKGVSKGAGAYFHLKDTRKFHALDQEVRVLKPGVPFVSGKTNDPKDYVMTKWPACSAPRRICQYCKQGNEARESGHRYWKLSTSYADQLITQQAAVRDYCKCAARGEEGEGTIRVTQYLCGNSKCGKPVDFYPEQGSPVAACGKCRQTLPPLEEVECTACDDPQRAGLQDFFFKVSRTGAMTDTTYNFEVIHPCKPPTDEELAEAAENRPDFVAILAPEPPELQAAAMGIPCPFQTPGHGAAAYGEEEEPEAAPAPRRAPAQPVRLGAPIKLGRANGTPALDDSEVSY